MELDQALAHAIDGNAILFLGAGFSRDAIAINGKHLPVGNELAKRLMAECGDDKSDADLPTASGYFIKRKLGKPALTEFLANTFTVAKPHALQGVVSSVRWKRIYTTNYDDLIELIYSANHKPLTPVTLTAKPEDYASRPNLYVHLNGCVRGLLPAHLDTELKLTTVSYLTENVSDSLWSLLFRNDIRGSRAIIFLGYSLYDLDIQRMLFADKATRDKCIFIVAADEKQEYLSRLEDFGTAFPIGTVPFLSSLQEKLKTYVPVVEEPLFLCFDELSEPTHLAVPRDDDLFAFLLKGDLSPDFTWHALAQPEDPDYYVVRQVLPEAFGELAERHNDVVLHADFANGKTALAQGLALEALSHGVRTFTFTGPGRTLARELQQIAQIKEDALVVFENYPRVLTEIQQLCLQAGNNIRLVFSARSSDHETYVERLARSIGHRGLIEFDVNQLTRSDENKLLGMLDKFGLWGKYAGGSRDEKLRLLRSKHHSEFQKVLLDVIHAPQAIEKLRELTAGLKEDTEALELVITLCVLNIIQVAPRLSLIEELTRADILRRPNFGGHTVLKGFFSLTGDQVSVRSPILAHHLLTDVFDADRTVDTLLKIAKRSESATRLEPLMRVIFRELQAFSHVQFMLPEKNKRPLLIKYYENLKNAPGCIKNPFFWLQYAIARLSFEDFEAAGRFFDTAYGLAKEMIGFDTYQIDNHFARFMLESSLDQSDPDFAFDQFSKSDAILKRQISDERRYYPYRVARHYGDVHARFFSSWSAPQEQAFLKSCQFILDRIADIKGRLRDHRYVQEAKRRLEQIVQEQQGTKNVGKT